MLTFSFQLYKISPQGIKVFQYLYNNRILLSPRSDIISFSSSVFLFDFGLFSILFRVILEAHLDPLHVKSLKLSATEYIMKQ